MNIQPIFDLLNKKPRLNHALAAHNVDLRNVDPAFDRLYVRVYTTLRRITIAYIAITPQRTGIWTHFHSILIDRCVNEGITLTYENVQSAGFYTEIITRCPEALIRSDWLKGQDPVLADSFGHWTKPIRMDHLSWDDPCLPDCKILCNPRQAVQA